MNELPATPVVVVIAGPNGAGKTTAASRFLPTHGGLEFVNADIIAAELAPGAVETVALDAGRRMLKRLAELRDARASFALETTLSVRTLIRFLNSCRQVGYRIELFYVWGESPELSVARVARRVILGGHHIPKDVIYRRYARGMINFVRQYRDIADKWILCDNSDEVPYLVAVGENTNEGATMTVLNEAVYEQFLRAAAEAELGSSAE